MSYFDQLTRKLAQLTGSTEDEAAAVLVAALLHAGQHNLDLIDEFDSIDGSLVKLLPENIPLKNRKKKHATSS